MSATLTAAPAESAPPNTNHWVRWGVFVFSATITAMAAVLFILAVKSSADLENADSIETIHYTETVKQAATQKLEGAKSLVQVSMILMGVLWSLVITKKEERVLLLTDKQELFGLILATFLLASTGICYMIYTDRMATVLTLGANHYDEPKDLTILNFRDPLINNVYARLQYIWGAAVITTALTLLSAHWLKPHPEKEEKECDTPTSPSVPSSAS